MPFGYYINYCYVENVDDTDQNVYLVGYDGADKCTMDQSILNLNIGVSYTSNDDWTTSLYSLTYDAFKFQTTTETSSTSMNLKCQVDVCLVDDCPTAASRSDCSSSGPGKF